MLILFPLFIVVIALYGVRFSKVGFFSDYMSKEKTNAIKGIFILFLTLGHIYHLLVANDSFPDGSRLNVLAYKLNIYFGQLVVVMFLFYSGYGVSEGIKKKGYAYVSAIPRKRILNTLLNFDVAVIISILMAPIICTEIEWTHLFQYLIAWENAGSANWYIFVILACYLVSFVVGTIVLRKQPVENARATLVGGGILLLIITSVLLSFFKDVWWYDTILCYGLGFFYSQYKTNVESFFQRNYIPSLCIAVFLFLFLFYYNRVYCLYHAVLFNIEALVFALLVVLLSMKVSIKNKVLIWLGDHLFPLYIYQALVYKTLFYVDKEHILASNYTFIYILVSFAITIFVASIYRFWQIKLK